MSKPKFSNNLKFNLYTRCVPAERELKTKLLTIFLLLSLKSRTDKLSPLTPKIPSLDKVEATASTELAGEEEDDGKHDKLEVVDELDIFDGVGVVANTLAEGEVAANILVEVGVAPNTAVEAGVTVNILDEARVGADILEEEVVAELFTWKLGENQLFCEETTEKPRVGLRTSNFLKTAPRPRNSSG